MSKKGPSHECLQLEKIWGGIKTFSVLADTHNEITAFESVFPRISWNCSNTHVLLRIEMCYHKKQLEISMRFHNLRTKTKMYSLDS